MLTEAQARALWLACVATLAGFWLQALWDLAHPPLYMSPWGPVAVDAAAPPGPP